MIIKIKLHNPRLPPIHVPLSVSLLRHLPDQVLFRPSLWPWHGYFFHPGPYPWLIGPLGCSIVLGTCSQML
jgi:hypothetical protein